MMQQLIKQLQKALDDLPPEVDKVAVQSELNRIKIDEFKSEVWWDQLKKVLKTYDNVSPTIQNQD